MIQNYSLAARGLNFPGRSYRGELVGYCFSQIDSMQRPGVSNNGHSNPMQFFLEGCLGSVSRDSSRSVTAWILSKLGKEREESSGLN